MDGNASRIVDRQNQQGEVAAGQGDDQSKKRCFLKESLPLGVGFCPSDAYLAELLVRKVASEDTSTFDFYSYDPDDLQLQSAMAEKNIHCHDDGKLYLFSAMRSKFPGAALIDRGTPDGLWALTEFPETPIENCRGEALAMKYGGYFYAEDHSDEAVAKRKRDRRTFTQKRTSWETQEFHLIGEKWTNIMLNVVYKDDKLS